MFGRKARIRIAAVHNATQIHLAFDKLTSLSPAAAYVFGRTAFNARELLLTSLIQVSMKISRIEAEISDSANRRQDQKVSVGQYVTNVALRFIVKYLQTKQLDEEASWGYATAYSHIAKYGASYRDLLPRDYNPPKYTQTTEILKSQGCLTIAEVVGKIRTEHETLQGSSQEVALRADESINETIWTTLAVYDLQDAPAVASWKPTLDLIDSLVA